MDLNQNCTKYVAFLRGLYLLHQNHHWLTAGANFYGNHLLFERLYKTAAENADLAAEKFIGLFGSDIISIKDQPALIQEFLEKHASSGDLVKSSHEAEIFFLDFSKTFYTELKKDSDKMTLGLDDAIMSIASDRETSVYLLKQTSGDNMNKVSKLAHKFQIKLAQMTDMERAGSLREAVNNLLTVNLANRNWGEVGFDGLNIVNQEGKIVLHCNLIIPIDSPPFRDKVKYPQGINQFKAEMMKLISAAAERAEPNNTSFMQIITVNGK